MKNCFFGLMFLVLFTHVNAQSSPRFRNMDTAAIKKRMAKVQYGIASWYSDKFNGRKTANGEIFSQQKMTCAHNFLPMGTWLKVTNVRNKRSVVVRVNDRLHPKNKRVVDVTRAAAQKLGMINAGLVKVKVDVLGKNPGAD